MLSSSELVALATRLIEAGPDGCYTFPQKAQSQLFEALKASFGTSALPENVRSLLVFAAFLETKKRSAAAADAIIDVLRGARTAFEAAGMRVPDTLLSVKRETQARSMIAGPNTKVEPVASTGPALKWWQAMKKDDAPEE